MWLTKHLTPLRNYSRLLAAVVCCVWVLPGHAVNAVYLDREHFLRQAFEAPIPESETLWVIDEVDEAAKAILGHSFGQLRVRYWHRERRSAWILEEIGKVLPITFGVVINDHRIEQISVMTYRESRGAEVRFPFFTGQFEGLFLQSPKDAASDQPLNYQLSGHIDGISGATLSVRAMTRVARLALYFHSLLVVENA